jgi:hypothetical protein
VSIHAYAAVSIREHTSACTYALSNVEDEAVRALEQLVHTLPLLPHTDSTQFTC